MGMYDEVILACPHCGHANEEQSKSGDCVLGRYHLDQSRGAKAISGLVGALLHCEFCKREYTVEEYVAPKYRTARWEET